ncbi:hypothetical protein [Microbacterium mcarthurae (nom. nud.)]|uniref:Uncharacterized protein n=1 Tax=Microbacterium mcarthurae TaxID=3035918 RepID=A0ABW9GIS5_9MICO
MASMSMLISPIGMDFIIMVVSIGVSRVLVLTEGPDAAQGSGVRACYASGACAREGCRET